MSPITVKPILVAAAVLAAGIGSAFAQEISASHEKAAREALAASGASEPFDDILLRLGARVKDQLTNARPDLADQIAPMVDEATIALAPRRGDLETEAAQIYARTFTEEELKEIARFYNTSAGKKILSDGPVVARELTKASRVWTAGIQRDLQKAATDGMQELTK